MLKNKRYNASPSLKRVVIAKSFNIIKLKFTLHLEFLCLHIFINFINFASVLNLVCISQYILTTLIKIIEKLHINFELTKQTKKLKLAIKLKSKI